MILCVFEIFAKINTRETLFFWGARENKSTRNILILVREMGTLGNLMA